MAKKKKEKIYFWLKFDSHFFENLVIKKARRLPGGDTMVVLYQRLMLLSLENNGVIYYEGELATLSEELSLKLSENEEEIKLTIAFFVQAGLIQVNDSQDLEMLQVPALLEQESSWARYKRLQRERKLDNVQPASKTCPTEKELEQELEKESDKELEQDQEQGHAVVGDAVPQGADLTVLPEGAVPHDGNAVSRQAVYEAAKEALGEMAISGFVVEEIGHLLKEFSAELIIEAFRETKLNAGRSIKYTKAILRNWQGKGLLTVEQVRAGQQAGASTSASNHQDWGI